MNKITSNSTNNEIAAFSTAEIQNRVLRREIQDMRIQQMELRIMLAELQAKYFLDQCKSLNKRLERVADDQSKFSKEIKKLLKGEK